MNIDFLKDLMYYITPFEYEGKKIHVFKDKQTFKSVFFVEESNKLSALDAETSLEMSKLFDNADSGIITNEISKTRKIITDLDSGSLTNEQRISVPFNEYLGHKCEVFLKKNNNKIEVPFVLRVSTDFEFDEEISVENFKTIVEESIKKQIEMLDSTGLDVNSLLLKLKVKPLSVNFYNFKNYRAYIVSKCNDEKAIHSNSIYVSTSSLSFVRRFQNANLINEEFNDLKLDIMHEFNHVLSNSEKMCGFNFSNFGISVFKSVNESLTEMIVHCDGSPIRESIYKEIASFLEPIVFDKENTLKCYFENNFEVFIAKLCEFYHCKSDNIIEFFAKLDTKLSMYNNGFENRFVDNECSKSILKIILNKFLFEEKDFLNNFEKFDSEMILKKFKISDNILKHLPEAKKEFLKENVFQTLSFNIVGEKAIFDNGAFCDVEVLKNIITENNINLEKLNYVKQKIGNVNNFIKFVSNREEHSSLVILNKLTEFSFDELLCLMKCHDPAKRFNPYLTQLVKRDLTNKQKNQLLFHLDNQNLTQIENEILGIVNANTFKNFFSSLDEECVCFVKKLNNESLLGLIDQNMKVTIDKEYPKVSEISEVSEISNPIVSSNNENKSFE